MVTAVDSSSTRPYLLRALYEWCSDNGFTPYIAVFVDETVQVPREYVKNNEIVLNISFDATSSLKLGNDYIEFKARFGGVAREIIVPVSRVIAIYARENGQGMAFPMQVPRSDGVAAPVGAPHEAGGASAAEGRSLQLVAEETSSADPAAAPTPDPNSPRSPAGGRPALKRIK